MRIPGFFSDNFIQKIILGKIREYFNVTLK